MNTYKITNITHNLDKRDINYNRVVDIIYVTDMMYKKIILQPEKSIYITCDKLPVSIQKLRLSGLVNVSSFSGEIVLDEKGEEKTKKTKTFVNKPVKKKETPKKRYTSTKKRENKTSQSKTDTKKGE